MAAGSTLTVGVTAAACNAQSSIILPAGSPSSNSESNLSCSSNGSGRVLSGSG